MFNHKSKKQTITQINKKNFNLILLSILLIFFIRQVFLLYQGGSTYDLFDLWLGAGYIYQKLIANINFEFSNPIFQNKLGQPDFFGYFFLLPAYLFERFINKISFNENNLPINTIGESFPSEDALTFFSMQLFLIFYSSILLFLIIKKLQNIYGINFSIIFLITIIFVPSFSGHMLFNLKDIPHLLNMFLAKIYIYDYFNNNSTKLTFHKIVILGFLISSSLSIRINALVFISFFIFSLLVFSENKIIFLKNVGKIFITSFIFLYLMTPQSWQSPIDWLIQSFEFQSNFNWGGYTLTNGKFILSSNTSNSYLFTWFYYRMPVFIHMSFIYFLYKFFKGTKKFNFTTYSLFFIVVNFALYPIIKPPAYDGLRHFLFLIPFFVIIFSEVLDKIESKKFIISALILYGVFTQLGLEQYKYTYFNEFVDLKEVSYRCEFIDGCGNWPTDYWSFSGKETADYLNQNFENENIVICRPSQSFKNYIELEKFNTFTEIDNLPVYKYFLVITAHRPRLNQDSCYFLINNVKYVCVEEFTLKKRYRFQRVNLGYLNKCYVKYG